MRIRKILSSLYRFVLLMLPYNIRESVEFYRHLGYLPNIDNPVTFNEKVQFMKKNWSDSKLTDYSDKIKVKEIVKNVLGSEFVIDNLYVGDKLTKDILLRTLNDNPNGIVVKANHNSGPVHILNGNEADSKLDYVVDSINEQLLEDFGLRANERWYSNIKPKVLIEKRLIDPFELKDYKFHVFNSDAGPKVFLHVDYQRGSNHNRSFFDENGKWLPFSTLYPTVVTELEYIGKFDEMKRMAIQLASAFDYARVDFYFVDERIYFGEVTFAHGGGFEKFTTKAYDTYLGRHWIIK